MSGPISNKKSKGKMKHERSHITSSKGAGTISLYSGLNAYPFPAMLNFRVVQMKCGLVSVYQRFRGGTMVSEPRRPPRTSSQP